MELFLTHVSPFFELFKITIDIATTSNLVYNAAIMIEAGDRLIDSEQIQKVADFYERRVVLLINDFKKKTVDIHGVPVYNLFIQYGYGL